MTFSTDGPSKRKHGLFTFAVVLLLFGGAALVVGLHDFAIRSIAVLACLISVYCIRASNVRGYSDSGKVTTQPAKSKLTRLFRRPISVVSIILLPLLGMSFMCLYRDATHGYYKVWPVYLFAGVAAVCAICWSYLVSSLL